MYFRNVPHRSKKKLYTHLQLVEPFRDPAKGKSPRTRILYNFGAIDDMGEKQLDRLNASLKKGSTGFRILLTKEMDMGSN